MKKQDTNCGIFCQTFLLVEHTSTQYRVILVRIGDRQQSLGHQQKLYKRLWSHNRNGKGKIHYAPQ